MTKTASNRENTYRIAWRRVVLALAFVVIGIAVAVVSWNYMYLPHIVRQNLKSLSFDGTTLLVNSSPVSELTTVFDFSSMEHPWFSQTDLRTLFAATANALTTKFATSPRHYIRTDEEGWEFFCAEWTVPVARATLAIGSGNDSDLVHLQIAPGHRPPDPTDKPASASHLHGKLFIR